MNSLVIITTAPISTTGASIIHLDLLSRLHATFECTIEFKTFAPINKDLSIKYPFINFQFASIVAENSNVVSGSMPSMVVKEAIIKTANEYINQQSRVVLWGVYVFPYALCISEAHAVLKKMHRECTLLLQPAGSDFWKFSIRLPFLFDSVLNEADAILFYSEKFRNEVCSSAIRNFNNATVIPPVMDPDVYFPISETRKSNLKKSFGISDAKFVFIHVSNMRYVKGINNTIILCKYIADRINQRCILFLVGPLTSYLENVLKDMSIDTHKRNQEIVYLSKNLEIRLTGEKRDIRQFLWASDCFVNTSYHDSFCRSLCEALYCGLFFISSSVVGLKDFFDKYPKGYYFDYTEFNFEDLIAEKQIEIEDNVLESCFNFCIDTNLDRTFMNEASQKAMNTLYNCLSWDHLSSEYRKLLSDI